MKKFQIIILTVFFCQLVNAAGPECQTDVLKTRVSNTGGLYISGSNISDGSFIFLCNLSHEINSLSINTCKSWLSILQTAQVSSRKVDISYKYTDLNVVSSCSSIPSGSNAPSPYFIQLTN
ncbi:hypothetical protein [Arcobacter sp. LA11]|uniref:hypothetical protein n=1 Tax=Arcobacter sp. LA11 TaxID=1898176 RepID=UPI000934C3DF|nr:hypothetical protein [Arcobacter sp. LA11]